jgi:hypothetical protein
MQNAIWQAFIDEEIYRVASFSNASLTLETQASGILFIIVNDSKKSDVFATNLELVILLL